MPDQGVDPHRRALLLRLAAELPDLDAEPADPLLAERLRVVGEALGHALVDLADGREAPTVHTPWTPRPRTRRPPRAGVADVDLASCSALAARWREATTAVAGATGPLATRLGEAVDLAATALQGYVQDVAELRRADPGARLPQELTTRVQQQLRRVHDLLVADGEPGRPGPGRGTTVPS
jgi:hypothetical protein